MSFSVVIPMFNGEATIVRAVASALAQTAPAAEIVVVDDGSTDAGPALIRSNFPTVRVLTQQNRGEGAARNAGIDAASADWIAFLDADDYWLPWHLEHLGAIVSSFPDVHMVAGAFAAIAPGCSDPEVARGRAERIDYFRAAARNSGVVHSSTVAIRRTAFETTGGFGDARHGADLEMWAKVALAFPVAASTATSSVYSLGIGVTATDRPTANDPRPPAPTELARLSPSAAVVVEALHSGDHLPPPRSLRRYLDSRIAWTMRDRIAAGDLDDARALRAMVSSAAWPENLAPMVVSSLPSAVTHALLGAKRTLRETLR